MKVRGDFVTNSSSSSFVIAKKHLDEEQIEAIEDHFALAENIGMPIDHKWDFPWNIRQNDKYITGYASMDNFSMDAFLRLIDVNMDIVTWGSYEVDLECMNEIVEDNTFELEEYQVSDWRCALRKLDHSLSSESADDYDLEEV